MTYLEKYLYQLRRIEKHREAKAEKEIRKVYKELLKELNGYLGNIYATYSEGDELNYSSLAKAGMDARFLEEVEQRINSVTPKVATQIQETVEATYKACYDGMVDAVKKAGSNRELLQKAFESVSAVTPDVIRANVNNPVSGLTLKDTLEKHRKDIIYDIKKNIGVGLSNGDRFSTMAKRIAESVDGDYNKSVRIVRTETHRVRESGFNDAATSINETLKQGKSGYVMAKTWRTMQDERVRPNKAKGKSKKYNHVKMDGVTIPQDELFKLPSGATCMCPSKTGVAGEDINCRCYLSYDLVLASELTKQDGTPYAKPKIDNPYVFENLPPHAQEYAFNEWDEYMKAAREYSGNKRYYDNAEWGFGKYTDNQKEMVKRFDLTIAEISKEYPLHDEYSQLVIGDYDAVQHHLNEMQRTRASKLGADAQAQAWINPDTKKPVIGFKVTGTSGTLNDDLILRQNKINKGEALYRVLDNSAEGVAIHEYGHLVSEYFIRGYVNDDSAAHEYFDWYKSLDKKDIEKGLSKYATNNRAEFEAECFAELLTGEPRKIARKYGEYLEKVSKGRITFKKK